VNHLHALELRRSHEFTRLAAAKTVKERELRSVWIAQVGREIVGERAFLGLSEEVGVDLSDDELLAELVEVTP